jgi:hypothetical protein
MLYVHMSVHGNFQGPTTRNPIGPRVGLGRWHWQAISELEKMW